MNDQTIISRRPASLLTHAEYKSRYDLHCIMNDARKLGNQALAHTNTDMKHFMEVASEEMSYNAFLIASEIVADNPEADAQTICCLVDDEDYTDSLGLTAEELGEQAFDDVWWFFNRIVRGIRV